MSVKTTILASIAIAVMLIGISYAQEKYQKDYVKGQVPELLAAPTFEEVAKIVNGGEKHKIIEQDANSTYRISMSTSEKSTSNASTVRADNANSEDESVVSVEPNQANLSFVQGPAKKRTPVRQYVAPGIRKLRNEINQDYDQIFALYTHLHQNPELSNKEFKTAAHLAHLWRGLGFEVTENVGGTGIVGVFKNGAGPTLMLRTDMDALPVREQTGLDYASTAKDVNALGDGVFVMHACGHDIHMSAVTGTLMRLIDRKESWSGTLVAIGQPAEELGQGAKAMLADGLFEKFPKPDFNVALHDDAGAPAGTVSFTSGPALANVDSVDILVKGIGGHGAYPHTTKDPVVLAAQIVNALQTLISREISPLDSAVVTVGSIHAGTKHNVISDNAIMQLTVRSFSDETREYLLEGIARIAEGQAKSYGLPKELYPVVTVKDEFTPVTVNNPELTARIMSAVSAQLGDDRVKTKAPVMGGEDFGRYGRTEDKIPSVIFWVGGVNEDLYADAKANGAGLPSLHSPFWAPDPEPTLKTAIEAMTAASMELLTPQEGR